MMDGAAQPRRDGPPKGPDVRSEFAGKLGLEPRKNRRADGARRPVTSSAVKVLSALEFICERDTATGLGELAQALGVSTPTAYRIMQTLVATGFARPAGVREAQYEPSLRVVELASRVLGNNDLRRALLPVLHELATRLGESVTLAVPDGQEIVFVERVNTDTKIRFYCDVGRRLPLHAGAAARAVLAWLPEPEFERYAARELPALTSATRTGLAALRADREQVREAGFAVSVDEVDLGISAVAVPLLAVSGTVVGSVAVANLTARWTGADRRRRGEILSDVLRREASAYGYAALGSR
jgi:DNA-binding IclR family transcriptional regulator